MINISLLSHVTSTRLGRVRAIKEEYGMVSALKVDLCSLEKQTISPLTLKAWLFSKPMASTV